MPDTRSTGEEISLAEQFDAKGEHDNAINALARATKLGDIEATTRLGKRLITGKNAPLLPTQGTGFLIDAFNRGGGEAAARLAVLAAAGVYVQSSLGEAVRLLGESARRGWPQAQTQLNALTADRNDDLSHADWQSMANAIDLTFWTSSPEGRDLSASPVIRSLPELLPDSICRWMIEYSTGRLNRALVYNAAKGQNCTSETRTNSWAQFDLMESELIHLLVQRRMQAACGIPFHHMEANAVLHYAVGEEISNHFDFVDPRTPSYQQDVADNGQRILTFLVYLNDDYDGGETEFPKLGIVHRGRPGEGLYFVNTLEDNQPDLRTLHAGRPPTRGEKWIVSQFVRGRRVLGSGDIPVEKETTT